MREIVFDTETTGLSFARGDRMVEIGCVELIDRVPTGNEFHAYFNPERPMPIEAFEVHGLSDAFLADKPLFTDQASELLDFLGDSALVAHNAGFDMSFLNGELKECGLEPLSGARVIDTVVLARQRHPGAKHSLDALCTRYGIDRSHRALHGALIDAHLLARVYIELTGGRQIGLGLATAESAPTAMSEDRSRIGRAPRVFSPSAEERARHAEFLATISNPLWALADG